jgi:phosphotransferase system  glucose/maltose/N-acetylglucosamine-specific IIC component
MKDYLIAWVLTALITLAGLFGVGFAVGLIGAITGSISDPDTLEQSGAFNTFALIAMAIINFFAFRFTVKKFVLKD